MKSLLFAFILQAFFLAMISATGAEQSPPSPAPSATPAASAAGQAKDNPDLAAGITALDIEPVWAGHSVGFALVTSKNQQFAAYYNANRQMSVAQRTLGQKEWKITRLDSFVQWDSHNYVTLAVDRDGYLHLCGNMHVVPLVYFRSTKPLDAASLEKVPAMTGEREAHCTYPVFLHNAEGAMVFSYRDGSSGRGDVIYNVYDEKSRHWSRLLDQPLLDGKDKMNAYPQSPKLGPDGYYHMAWVWRDSPNAETNHDLSYARSKNLRAWETVDGHPLQLPITLGTPGVIVDPVPVKGGIINGSGTVGFDKEHHVVIAYHKFDQAGNTQLYFARYENGAWKQYLASDWHYRWYFHGGGSLNSEIRHGSLEDRGGRLVISIQHPDYGSSLWEVDDKTLRLKEKVPSTDKQMPPEYRKVESQFPGMAIRGATDSNGNGPGGVIYRLRWESLGPERDQPRPEPWPSPSMLRLLVLP